MAVSENEPTSSSSGEEVVSSEESVSKSEPEKTSTQPPSSSPPLIKPTTGKRPPADGDRGDSKRAAKKKSKVLAEGDGGDLERAVKKDPVVLAEGDLKRASKKKSVVLAEGEGGDLKRAAKKKSAVLAAGDGGDLKRAKKNPVVLAEGDGGDLKRAAKKKSVVLAEGDGGDLKRAKKNPVVLAEGDGGDLKRAEKRPVVLAVAAPKADIGGEKKVLFERLWSEENEIELIQGMLKYVEEKRKDPFADVSDFHEFVKKSLDVDVSDKQVLAKLRKLKNKYKNNVAKLEKDGKIRSFSNPHEKKLYELSENLWGSEKVNAKVKVNEKGEINFKVGQLGLQVTDEGIMNKGLELLSGPMKVEMEEKWKNLKVQELEHFVKKLDILKEQAEIVLNAIMKSGGK